MDNAGMPVLRPANKLSPEQRRLFLASQGIFIGTQLIAISVGVSLARIDRLIAAVGWGQMLSLPEIGQVTAGVLAGAGVIITWALLQPHRADAKSDPMPAQALVGELDRACVYLHRATGTSIKLSESCHASVPFRFKRSSATLSPCPPSPSSSCSPPC